ncbi:hypothetical protein COD11_12455 [Bacillus sp. AFS040349]|nr:hypothetical protein COD11_12455 [Bacillus sp. AFS040349]
MIKREKLLKLWDNIRKMGKKILVLSGNTIILFYKGRGVKEIEVEKRKNKSYKSYCCQREIEEMMGIWKRGYYRKNGAIRQK